MRRPQHDTPPRHLNIDYNPKTGLYDVSKRHLNMEECPVYSMPLEIIRVLAKYYRLRSCGTDVPSLEKFYNDLSKEDKALVITTANSVKQKDDFFPDPVWE